MKRSQRAVICIFCFFFQSSRHPLVGRCYVVHSGPVYGWQRCRMLERLDECDTCQVLLVDLAITMEFPFESLYEIEPEFTGMCCMGFRAYLVDIVPPSGAPVWSQESTDGKANTIVSKRIRVPRVIFLCIPQPSRTLSRANCFMGSSSSSSMRRKKTTYPKPRK